MTKRTFPLHRSTPGRALCFLLVVIFLLPLASCTSLLTSTVIKPAIGNLNRQHDVDLVCEGAASYLLMIDSLIESNPTSRSLLLIGAQSYSGSVAALESCGVDERRLAALSIKAKRYGTRLLTGLLPLDRTSHAAFDKALASLTPDEAPELFWGAFGWLTWVTRQQGTPAAMIDLIAIEKIMARLLELDEGIENGGPHLFFGALLGTKPALLGGNPELSRAHFERALELSDRKFLIIHTTYAATYCRMVFNKELHDSLLAEVLAFPSDGAPELALSNQIATRKARQLLAENYFGD